MRVVNLMANQSETKRYPLPKQISELRIHPASIKRHSCHCVGRKTTATITALLSNTLTNNRLPPTGISVYGVINIRVSLKRVALRREVTPWAALGGPSLAPKSGARVIFDCRGETTDE
ncbi:hypothetical protein ALC60_14587 [Trachymyrmex zeteki]|uniref:Uncharacterized protein n=1 Tax=Mycetomoellerius zeteki TaxID=64791 RepID=A0A151WF60_9HYME|nr:hypothetical protein ALC60_14587 [Trachymyrmex zeteki]